VGLVFAADFNDLDMALRLFARGAACRIGYADYAMDGLKK
jgi:hypothetical protein